jgi:hypothetical protein
MSSSREADRRLPGAGIVSGLSIVRFGLDKALHMTAPWRQRAEAWLDRRRRTVAVLVSLALHGVLIALFLIGATSKISGGGAGGESFGGGPGSGIGVELVSAQEAMPNPSEVKQPDPDSHNATDAAAIPASTVADATPVTPDTPEAPAVTEASATATETAMAAPASPGGETAAGGDGSGGQSSGVIDPLWQKVEPCWRRLAAPGTRGTLLRVSISPMGNIAQVTDDSSPSLPADPKSQAEAAEALSECGPYLEHSSRENVVLSFPAVQ